LEHSTKNVAPYVGEAQRVGNLIFGRFAVFQVLDVFVDSGMVPSQSLGDLLLGEAQRVGLGIFGRFAVFGIVQVGLTIFGRFAVFGKLRSGL